MLQGGDLVIAHAGQTKTFSPSAEGFSSYWAAFYAGDAVDASSCPVHVQCNTTHTCASGIGRVQRDTCKSEAT